MADPAELAIVVPTYNESANIAALVDAVAAAMLDIAWEIVFVDDNSPDGTAAAARALALADTRVRCVHRYNRRGLSSACVEGIMATAAPYVAVMDADHQHDEAILPRMLAELKAGADVVVGSRYATGGGMGDWHARRQAMSRFATRIANRFTGSAISDPMSGFFMLKREVFLDALPRLSTIGFKILLDIAASSPRNLRFAEVPYHFRNRLAGESKLDSMVLWEYLLLLLDKTVGRFVPVRFISFALVGGLGVIVHFFVLSTLFVGLDAGFRLSQAAATGVAIQFNFLMNNMLTYRDRRLKGRRLILGWLMFNLVSATGAIANVGISGWVYAREGMWVLSALAGIAVGVVWNYAMSSIFTWSKK